MSKLLSRPSRRPFLVAGPCSAETEIQVLGLARELAKSGVDLFRAGVWKPRTRPNTFEGAGEQGLKWMKLAREETGLRITTEVASPRHLELALKYDVDVIWIGARTTANPFSVQQLSDALEGVDIPVFVKNPVNPDLSLWIGAVERVMHAGIEDIGLIHRGFSYFNSGKYRNSPLWQIPIEMHGHFPELAMICDISHICGVRELLFETAQSAMDLAYDGLMVETHPDPPNALSDSAQQITVPVFDRLIQRLVIRRATSLAVQPELEVIRDRIDQLDRELVSLLGERMKLSEEIGAIKELHEISVLQPKRWSKILDLARANGVRENLGLEFIDELFKAIHQESINHQLLVMNTKKDGLET